MLFIGIDTALQNTAVVILDEQCKAIFSGKPFPKKENHDDWGPERISIVYNFIKKNVDLECELRINKSVGRLGPSVFLGIEDYLLTGHQKAYETAELVGVIRNWCIETKVSYCMNHPQKVLKFVRKAKDVSKTEIIAFVKDLAPECFNNIEKADYSDVADAYVNARCAKMVYEVIYKIKSDGKVGWTKEGLISVVRSMPYEDRWKEILLGASSPWDTGILTKQGLYRYY